MSKEVGKWFLDVLMLGAAGGVPAMAQEVQAPFSGGKTSLTLPLQLHRGHLLLEVEVNGGVLHLTVDNGVLWDQLLLYGGPTIDALELELDETDPDARSGDAPPPMASASGLSLKFPGLVLSDQRAFIAPASSNFARLFEGEDGVISGTLFSHFVVELDFERLELTLTSAEGFEYRGGGHELALEPGPGGAFTLPCTN